MTMSSPFADAATVRSHPPVPTMPRSRIVLGVLAIALTALDLRPAVVSVSPIYSLLRQSFPVSPAAQSVMGTLPLFCFAIFGVLGGRIARRLGLEGGLILALAITAGTAGQMLAIYNFIGFPLRYEMPHRRPATGAIR